jgi:hypothetical protein
LAHPPPVYGPRRRLADRTVPHMGQPPELKSVKFGDLEIRSLGEQDLRAIIFIDVTTVLWHRLFLGGASQ